MRLLLLARSWGTSTGDAVKSKTLGQITMLFCVLRCEATYDIEPLVLTLVVLLRFKPVELCGGDVPSSGERLPWN